MSKPTKEDAEKMIDFVKNAERKQEPDIDQASREWVYPQPTEKFPLGNANWWINEGRLEGFKAGAEWGRKNPRYLWDDIDEFITSNRLGTSEQDRVMLRVGFNSGREMEE